MDRDRVLYIFFQTGIQANGGVNSLMQIITNLKKCEPIVFTQMETKANEELRRAGIKVLVSNNFGYNGKSVVSWIKYQFSLLKVLKSENIDCIHVNDIIALSYSFIVIKLMQAKFVFNLRGVKPPNQSYGKKWELLNYAKKVIVLSNDMKTELEGRLPLFKKSKNFIEAIYSIVDLQRFKPLVLKKTNLQFNIVISAVFNERKNQLSFICACADLIKKENIVVHFVGDADNEYGKMCRGKVKELSLQSNTFFHGFVDNVQDYYQMADLTLVISKSEGMARSMIESIACGVPVFSFNVSSAKEILDDNTCGSVVNQGDYSVLEQKIIEFKSNDDLRLKMSNNARITAMRLFDKEFIIAQYEKLYKLN